MTNEDIYQAIQSIDIPQCECLSADELATTLEEQIQPVVEQIHNTNQINTAFSALFGVIAGLLLIQLLFRRF